MKKLLLIIFILAISSAFAQRSFQGYTISTFVSQSQLETLSGVTNAIAQAIAIDSDGSILCVVDPSGADGNLLDIDPSGASATIVAPETGTVSLDSGQASPSGDLDIDRLAVASDGTIYLSEHDSDDDVIKVVRTPSLAISNVSVVPGNTGVALDEANSRLFITTEASFGGDDDIKYYPLPGGPIAVGASTAQITAASGATGVSVTTPLMRDSQLLVYDEAFYSGADAILGLTNPGATPTVTVEYATGFFPDGAPGISSMTSDSEGNLYSWNEYSAGSSRITIIRASDDQVTEIPEDTINALLGFSDLDVYSNGGLAAKIVDAQTAILYFSNPYATGGGGVYSITFTTSTAADTVWFLYE